MDALGLFKEMLRIRRFEEKCAEVYSAGFIRGFLHLYIGEEAVAVGAMQALRPEDAVVATYREHGHALARGVPMGALMAEMYGKATGCSKGHGGSMHLFDVSRRFYGGYGIVGGGIPVATGLAMADKFHGEGALTVCFFGEGAMAEGEFHESMNLASLWALPVLFLCENNRYAMGTAIAGEHAERDLHRRAKAYGVASAVVDGMNVEAVREAVRLAADQVRGGEPFFLEARTYRFRAHSMSDPELYRTQEEVNLWKQRDPLHLYAEKLTEEGRFRSEDLTRLEAEVAAEIREAVAFAEAGTLEPVADLLREVRSEVSAWT